MHPVGSNILLSNTSIVYQQKHYSKLQSPRFMAVRAVVNCSGLETHYEDVTTDLQNGFLLVYSVLVFVIGESFAIQVQVKFRV